MEVVKGEFCPFCQNKTLTLRQTEQDVPYFGPAFIFSMDCSNCHYHKADVELETEGKPIKQTLEISSEDDLKIRVIKSSNGTIKLPRIGSIEPGEAANGYITNVEGVINRIKHQIETIKDTSDEKEDVKKAKKLLKKITKILWGQESITLTLEDPTGNSAIISDKVIKK